MCEVGSAPLDTEHFVIVSEAQTLRFLHWGRPINAFRLGRFSSDDGKSRGFDDDLVKMLVLQSSDKSSEGEPVTGKFGLGFKSGFLFSDTPRILSGQLGFEVVAGMFPAPLQDGDRCRLQAEIDRYAATHSPGTVVELLGRNGSATDDVLQRFRRLAPLLLPFAHRLRRITLAPADGTHEQLAWNPQSLTEHILIGWTSHANGSAVPAGMLLILSGRENSALMFRIDVRGLIPLAAEVPTFWVTAPTDENLSAGFAVNGNFKPDVGRRSLPQNSLHNERVAQRLGEDLARAFIELFVAARDWTAFIHSLRMSSDVEPYVFWESLLTIVARPQCYAKSMSAGPLLKSILWAENHGIVPLLTQEQALPNGLCGKYRALTRLHDVQFVTRGALDDQDVFDKIASWPSFLAAVRPEEIVSGAGIWDRIAPFAGNLPKIRPIHLLDVLQWELRGQILQESAELVGLIIDEKFIGRYGDIEKDGAGTESLRDYLRQLQFRAQDGTWRTARELIVVDCPDETSTEEADRAAFAPDSRLLNTAYGDVALKFFKVCRQKMEASATSLADWGSQAADNPGRWRAFIKYIATGELRDHVGEALDENTLHKLRDDIQDESLDIGLSQEERTRAAGATSVGMDAIKNSAQSLFAIGPQATAQYAEPKTTLNALWEWWQREKHSLVAKYDCSAYSDASSLFRVMKEDYLGTPVQRQAWFTLLLRGSLETMGYFKDGTHRNFIEICERYGWLRELSADANTASRLISHIEGFLDKKEQDAKYFHWLRTYMPMSVFVRWLDEYVRSFLSINHKKQPFDLNHILSPRTNPEGSGELDAPPIEPMLGIGAHFVLRELARHGIISSPHVNRYAYLPTARVRRLVAAIGGPRLEGNSENRAIQSTQIHKFLTEHLGNDRATFDLAFDIPLQLIVDSDERDDVLGRSEFNWKSIDDDGAPLLQERNPATRETGWRTLWTDVEYISAN